MFNLTLSNFRSFLNQEFKFSKMNILIGENSSGKSSILKFFLALKQTLENPLESNLKLQGDYVDLGSYNDIIYYHNEEKTLQFEFEFDAEYHKRYFKTFLSEFVETSISIKTRTINDVLRNINSKSKIKVKLTRNLDSLESKLIEITNQDLGVLRIVPNKSKTPDGKIAPRPTSNLKYRRKSSRKTISLNNCEYQRYAFLTLVYPNDIEKQLPKNTQQSTFFLEIAYLLITQNLVDHILENSRYVNPINANPQRIYIKRDKKSVYPKTDIEKIVHILSDKNVLSNFFIRQFNNVLKDFGLANGIKIKSTKGIPVNELIVSIVDLWSNITDIGYGVALQLPILFETILGQDETGGRIIFVEQPEVHLHPKLQAMFIEILLKYGSKNTYFIETHSEHIIRKLQALVKEKKYNIKASEISIHYLRRKKKKSLVTQHKILENGKLLPIFPSGFFDTSYKLAKRLHF